LCGFPLGSDGAMGCFLSCLRAGHDRRSGDLRVSYRASLFLSCSRLNPDVVWVGSGTLICALAWFRIRSSSRPAWGTPSWTTGRVTSPFNSRRAFLFPSVTCAASYVRDHDSGVFLLGRCNCFQGMTRLEGCMRMPVMEQGSTESSCKRYLPGLFSSFCD
jgi:hypothetical protein